MNSHLFRQLRKLKLENMNTIEVQGERNELKSPLRLTSGNIKGILLLPENSGSMDSPVTYHVCPDETMNDWVKLIEAL